MQPEPLFTEAKPDISTWPRVTRILEATGVADYSKVPNAEFYKQRGREVHLLCADIDAGVPDYWSGDELEGFAKAWISFKKETGFTPTLIETPVHHPVRQYRGTLDRVGYFSALQTQARILLDIKSGIVADWVRLQTAAYAACLEKPEEIQRYGLQLKKDGTFRISEVFKDYRSDSNAFFSLVSCYHVRAQYGRTIVTEDE